MKSTGKCPKCGSTDIIADAMAIDHTRGGTIEFTIATFRDPNAMLFKGLQTTAVSAWVCAKCGFTEFYADSPMSLKVAAT